jgi:hypothetical protein
MRNLAEFEFEMEVFDRRGDAAFLIPGRNDD